MNKFEDFCFNHSFIASILIVLFILAVVVILMALAVYSETGFRAFHYEYVDSDGNTNTAVYCSVPYMSISRCNLEDGSTVFDIKSFRRVVDE